MMNLRKILGAALLLGAVVAYIRIVELPREESSRTATQPLRGVSPQAFSEVVVTREGETFRLLNGKVEDVVADASAKPDPVALASVDRSKSWRLADVPAGGLDAGAINSLLTSLVGVTLDKPIPAAELDADRGIYGLAEPRLVVTARRGGSSYEFRFGILNEFVAKRYVGFGEEVYLLPDALFTAADKKRDQFRNRTPVEFADSDLAGVSIAASSGPLTFVSDESYRWRMTQPAEYPASDTAMATLARALRNLRVGDFIDTPEAPERYGFDKPKLAVKLDFRPGTRPEPMLIEVAQAPAGGAVETYLRLNSGAVFRLPSDPTDTIVKPSVDFREKMIFRFPAERIERVVLERPSLPAVEMVRRDADWTVDGQPGDRPFVEQVVRGLAGLQASGFPESGAVVDFKAPAAVFVVTVRGEKVGDPTTTYHLRFSARAMDGRQETEYYGRVDDSEDPFIVGAGTFKALTPLRESLVKATGDTGSVVAPAATGTSGASPE